MSVSASTGLVRVVLAITFVIALGKFAAATWTGSSAMLAAAVHALVDLSSQGLMVIGLRRSASNRPGAPRGNHGGDIYFWSYVAGVLLFSMGAGVAIYDGAHRLVAPRPIADPIIAYWVAGLAALLQGFSAWHILRAIPRGADDQGFFSAVARASDAPLLTLVAENIAGLAGLVLTVLGISIAQLAGHASADGAASMAIGLLLAAVATFLSLTLRKLVSGGAETIVDAEATQATATAIAVPVPSSDSSGPASAPQPPSSEFQSAESVPASVAHEPRHGGHTHGKHHGKKKGRHRPR